MSKLYKNDELKMTTFKLIFNKTLWQIQNQLWNKVWKIDRRKAEQEIYDKTKLRITSLTSYQIMDFVDDR